ncbi:LppP/LprE family lipoprotein [Corynebacterium renale]|uniref:LppP/LprE lipoprotein n=1 Tax=Corynebacterium renale TaxID=1724 RepID=A0A2A9DLJ8_9CORY|nr:LppP/LprE family lipoprotein [Corynebacterium renale]PFG27617.1 LppP/LprE lipoprotein [Corynebacterium renale]SQI22800.1 Uncharacterised protein [Corynebacterium renale]
MKTRLVGVTALALGLTVAGCGTAHNKAQEEPEVVTVTSTITEEPTPEPSTVVVTETSTASQNSAACGTQDGLTAVRENIHTLKPDKYQWDADCPDLSGYDPCADLSWAAIHVYGGTGSSPIHFMLFHKGEYVGTATEQPEGLLPSVDRLSDDAFRIIYSAPREGESNSEASGAWYRVFNWSDAENRVIGSERISPD